MDYVQSEQHRAPEAPTSRYRLEVSLPTFDVKLVDTENPHAYQDRMRMHKVTITNAQANRIREFTREDQPEDLAVVVRDFLPFMRSFGFHATHEAMRGSYRTTRFVHMQLACAPYMRYTFVSTIDTARSVEMY